MKQRSRISVGIWISWKVIIPDKKRVFQKALQVNYKFQNLTHFLKYSHSFHSHALPQPQLPPTIKISLSPSVHTPSTASLTSEFPEISSNAITNTFSGLPGCPPTPMATNTVIPVDR